jgi:putative spermidine/putrescine transport system permease protein
VTFHSAELAELQDVVEESSAARPRRAGRRGRWAWLGLIPFLAYMCVFLLIPTGELIVDAFRTPTGSFTFSNISGILQGQYLSAFWESIELSGLSALIGGVLGFLIANAVVSHGMPRWARTAFVSYSGMAANFAGIPLAFAFGATLGAGGVLTGLFTHLGLHLYPSFSLDNILGLTLVYVYFQFPLMILLILPALDGLRREWKEAASNLGANYFQFWRHVGFPIIAPSLLGMMVLLFGNAFSAYATASALSGNAINLVTIDIANYINGNISIDPQLAYALAFGMIVVIIVVVVLYTLLQRRASRWLR